MAFVAPSGLGCACGLGCSCGGNCPMGMGSFDLSTLSYTDYLAIGAGLVGAYFLFTSKPIGRRRRRKGGDPVSSFGMVVGLLAAGYVGYQYLTGGSILPTLN
jgi:hypothetical protein